MQTATQGKSIYGFTTRNARSMTLRLPQEVDPTSLWAFINAMGWMQYVVTDQPVEADDPISRFCGKWSDDPTPIDEMLDEMRCHRNGDNVIESLFLDEA